MNFACVSTTFLNVLPKVNTDFESTLIHDSAYKKPSSQNRPRAQIQFRKMSKQIAIIGAGLSGLLACKYAMEKGFNPIVFEAKSGFGGVWSRTLKSTKLQTPREYYQFSDFPWPDSVTGDFPHSNQVMEYLQSYAVQFNIIPNIKFNCRVIDIDYETPFEDHLHSWTSWGGCGQAFSPFGKWNVTVENHSSPQPKTEVHFIYD